MHRFKIKKNAFTLAETIIVCTIFAIMVVWIILWINRAFLFMNNTRVLVRATNFAREWVEMVYNIRDTNRRKCSGYRDKTRLYTGGSEDCKDWSADVLKKWIYLIKEAPSWDDTYVYAEYLTGDSEEFYDLDWFFNEDNAFYRNESKIVFSWEYSYYSGGKLATWNLEYLLGWSGIEFYRILRVYGIYCKNDTDPNQVVDPSHCNDDSDPKELRFCVKVFYEFNGWHHASELCSIMTNFMK